MNLFKQINYVLLAVSIFGLIVSFSIYGENQRERNVWSLKNCLTWNTVNPDNDPIYCQIIYHLQEPISQVESSWVEAICTCSDNSCLDHYNNTGSQVDCWYENETYHAQIRTGPHPGPDLTPAYTSTIVFLVLTCLFTITFMAIKCYEYKQSQTSITTPEMYETL